MADNSVISLVNVALTHLGEPAITDITESPPCDIMYPVVRDRLLSWYRWSFATTRKQLSRLSAAPVSGYDYQYSLAVQPHLLRVLDIDTRGRPYEREVFVDDLTPANQTPVLLTDASSVVVQYIARVSEAVWSRAAWDVAALWLATSVSSAISGKASLRSQLFTELTVALDRAMLIDGGQDTPRRLTLNDTYIAARMETGASAPLVEAVE